MSVAVPGVEFLNADLVVDAFREAGAMTLPEVSKLTGVRVTEVITIAVHENDKRLRQIRGADVLKVKWEAVT